MNFTVLGAGGFIGSHLVRTLRHAGHDVYAPARDAQDMYRRPLGHVLYCVGLTADFRSRPFDTARAHVGLLTDMLEKSDFESLVYLSSTRVYAGGINGSETASLQVDVADPANLYNLTKLTGESLCRSCGRTGVKAVRLSNVVDIDHGSQNFLFSLIRDAVGGRIELQSDPTSGKDYILLQDVLDLLPRIASEGKDWLYNVASGANISHRDIVTRLAELTGCEVTVRPGAPVMGFPVIDTQRIQNEFGFSASPILPALPRLVSEMQFSGKVM